MLDGQFELSGSGNQKVLKAIQDHTCGAASGTTLLSVCCRFGRGSRCNKLTLTSRLLQFYSHITAALLGVKVILTIISFSPLAETTSTSQGRSDYCRVRAFGSRAQHLHHYSPRVPESIYLLACMSKLVQRLKVTRTQDGDSVDPKLMGCLN